MPTFFPAELWHGRGMDQPHTRGSLANVGFQTHARRMTLVLLSAGIHITRRTHPKLALVEHLVNAGITRIGKLVCMAQLVSVAGTTILKQPGNFVGKQVNQKEVAVHRARVVTTSLVPPVDASSVANGFSGEVVYRNIQVIANTDRT